MGVEHHCLTVVVVMVIVWAASAKFLHTSSPSARLTLSEPTTANVSLGSFESRLLKHYNQDYFSNKFSSSLGKKPSLSRNFLRENESFDTPGVSKKSSTFLLKLGRHRKWHNSSDLCWNNSTNSPPPCSNYSGNYIVNITHSSPCYFSCTYLPNKKCPIRLEVNLRYDHSTDHPSFIVAQQTYNISAWTLPLTFPALDYDQMFTSLAATLCPPWNWGERQEIISVRLTTESDTNATLQVSLRPDTNFHLLKTINRTVKSSPAEPWYKLYMWDDGEQSVLVTADAGDKTSGNICANLILQNARCPVNTDIPKEQSGGIRYQSFTERGAMVAHRDQYPDGVFIIVRPLPDDKPCTLKYSAHSNRSTRAKSVLLEVWNHQTFSDIWYIYIIASIIVIAAATGFAIVSVFCIQRNLSANLSDDRARLLCESGESGASGSFHVQEESGILFAGIGDPNRHTGSQNLPNNPEEGIHNIMDNEGGSQMGELGDLPIGQGSRLALQDDGGGMAGALGTPYPLPTTYTPDTSLMNFTESFNPLYVMWWKRVAVFQIGTTEFQVSEVGFQNNIIIMAVFAALPTTELLRYYLSMLMYHGMEDQCIFNSRCLTALGTFPDFTRVFSNIGYIFVGAACVFIIRKHQQLTQAILKKYTTVMNSVGVSRHYGLFTSLGYGLIIQGIMSALYHTCPNKVTIRFDMMFMYIVLVVCIVIVWGLRHGDVTQHVYPTSMGVGAALMLAELREWVSPYFFWSIFAIIYCILLISNTILMARYGIWSFSPYKIWQVWKGWRPVTKKLEEMVQQSVVNHSDQTSTPLQVVRVVIGFMINIVLIICGFLIDPNVYTYILIVCLVNSGFYFLNYVLTKKIAHKEKGILFSWLCLIVSLVLWIPALATYFVHSSNSEISPASSRVLNEPCVLLGVFDYHDIWHITSAFALGLLFIGLLTLDDDLSYTLSEKIHVF